MGGVRPPAKCGTDGGYYRHLRVTLTPVCDPCRLAHNEATRAMERRRREGRACQCGAKAPTGRCRSCAAKKGREPKPKRSFPRGRCTGCGKETRAKGRVCQQCIETDYIQAPTWIRRGLIWVAEKRDERDDEAAA